MISFIEKSDTKMMMLVIIAALVIVQLAMVLQVYWGRDLSAQFHGSASYRQIAENIVEKGLYSLDGVHATAYRPPLYPLFLALLMWPFRQAWVFAAISLQSLMDILAGVLTVSISLTVFRSKLGTSLAAFLYIIHLRFHLESVRQRETVLFALLLLLFTHLLISRRKNFFTYATLSLVSAFAYLTRPTGVLFLPILLLAILLERGKLIKNQEGLTCLAVVILLFVAVTLPYHAYLYRQFSRFSPLVPSSTTGLNLYQGNNPTTERIYPYVDVDLFYPWIQDMLAQERIDDEFQASQFLRDRAIDYIVKHPAAFVKRAVAKLCALYSPVATPLGSGRLVERDGKVVLSDFRFGPLSKSAIFNAVFITALLAGAIAFLVRMRRCHGFCRIQVFLILCPIALVTLVHMITFAETRFRLPLDPLIIILAASYYSSKLREW